MQERFFFLHKTAFKGPLLVRGADDGGGTRNKKAAPSETRATGESNGGAAESTRCVRN